MGATGTVGWLIFSTFSALGVGFLSMIARAIGAGDKNAAKRVAAQSALVTLATGVVSTALCCAISGVVPTWMRVDPAIRGLAGRYFLII